jgi:hypothetical protein
MLSSLSYAVFVSPVLVLVLVPSWSVSVPCRPVSHRSALQVDGTTPLIKACLEQHVHVVKVLLAAGADTEIEDEVSQFVPYVRVSCVRHGSAHTTVLLH